MKRRIKLTESDLVRIIEKVIKEQTDSIEGYEECKKLEYCMPSEGMIKNAQNIESTLIGDGYKKVEEINLPDGIYGSGGVDAFGEGKGKLKILNKKPDPANFGPFPEGTRFRRNASPARPAKYYSIVFKPD